jgi:hypothetical protein
MLPQEWAGPISVVGELSGIVCVVSILTHTLSSNRKPDKQQQQNTVLLTKVRAADIFICGGIRVHVGDDPHRLGQKAHAQPAAIQPLDFFFT